MLIFRKKADFEPSFSVKQPSRGRSAQCGSESISARLLRILSLYAVTAHINLGGINALKFRHLRLVSFLQIISAFVFNFF